MLRTSFAALLLLVPIAVSSPSAAPAAHPISGIATSSFGGSCGLGSPPLLALGWDAGTGSLLVQITSITGPPLSLAGHFLLYGASLLPAPFPLPPPSWQPGCELLIAPVDAIGPFVGNFSAIPISPNPLLVGMSFFLQAIPEYAVASPFPAYGITQGVKLTFL